MGSMRVLCVRGGDRRQCALLPVSFATVAHSSWIGCSHYFLLFLLLLVLLLLSLLLLLLSSSVFKRAFQADYAHSKIGQLGGMDSRQRKELQGVLEEHYPYIVRVFRHYMCLGSGDIHSMQQIAFTAFARQCAFRELGGVDDDPNDLTLAQLNLIFVAVNKPKPKGANQGDFSVGLSGGAGRRDTEPNSIRDMIRYEFLEALVMLSRLKYGQRGMAFEDDAAQCMTELMHNDVLTHATVVDADVFRKQRLYFQEVDLVFRDFIDRLLRIFKYYGNLDNDTIIGHVITMTYHEYCGMLDHLPGIESDEGAARAGRQCFIMSMMIVIDETVTDKYRTASFVDFLEVLARMANDSAFTSWAPDVSIHDPYTARLRAFLTRFVDCLLPRLPKKLRSKASKSGVPSSPSRALRRGASSKPGGATSARGGRNRRTLVQARGKASTSGRESRAGGAGTGNNQGEAVEAAHICRCGAT